MLSAVHPIPVALRKSVARREETSAPRREKNDTFHAGSARPPASEPHGFTSKSSETRAANTNRITKINDH